MEKFNEEEVIKLRAEIEATFREFKDKHELRDFLDYLCKQFKGRYDKL